jgi:SET domain-containing protein
MIHSGLHIQKTVNKGNGVFTNDSIEEGTIIEISPVVVMTLANRALLDQTLLHDYIFEWGHEKEKCAMALGYVPVYNHSYSSNCEYFMDYEDDVIFVKTVRKILPGEELTINYNGDWNDEKKVWFDVS